MLVVTTLSCHRRNMHDHVEETARSARAVVRDGTPISTKPSPRPSRGSMACASLSNPAASPAGTEARLSSTPSEQPCAVLSSA